MSSVGNMSYDRDLGTTDVVVINIANGQLLCARDVDADASMGPLR